MPKSKAHEYWNRFRRWAQTFGALRVEEQEALDEFFISPAGVPKDSLPLAYGFFSDWFLMDRKLTRRGITPLEMFIQVLEQEKKGAKQDLAVYRKFMATNRFGLFRIEEASPGEWIDLKAVPGGGSLRVFEQTGSRQAEKGSYLVGRLVAFEDHWAMSNAGFPVPKEGSYSLDRLFSMDGEPDSRRGLTPREAVRFLMPKTDWGHEDLGRVRARLASILQKSGVDVPVSRMEESIREAHAKKAKRAPFVENILRGLSAKPDFKEAADLVSTLWNRTLAECDPALDPRVLNKGPLERMLLGDMNRMIQERFLSEGSARSKPGPAAVQAAVAQWLDLPQRELDGKTPREAILAERKALGNPQERIGYEVSIDSIEPSADEIGAGRMLAEGEKALRSGLAEEALRCYEGAYQRLKGHPETFRILGNLATAHAMLGNRKQSLEMLRAALKLNPDYRTARDNLHLMESMSPEEFEKKRLNGFFGKMKFVMDDRKKRKPRSS